MTEVWSSFQSKGNPSADFVREYDYGLDGSVVCVMRSHCCGVGVDQLIVVGVLIC